MPSPLQRPFILLVDDTEDDAIFFEWTLRRSGATHRMTHVADGDGAIDHLQSAANGAVPFPDIIFLDLKMPGRSGFDVLEWIRRQQFDPPMDVTVLSGSEHDKDQQRALALGAASYLVKPIRVPQLTARLTDWQALHGSNLESAHVPSGPMGRV